MSTAHPPFTPQIRLYQDWLARERGLHFDDYDALWRWSTTDLDAFWQSIWDYFDLRSPTPHTAVLGRNVMPGAQWFPGAQANYAQQVFRHVEAAHAAGQRAHGMEPVVLLPVGVGDIAAECPARGLAADTLLVYDLGVELANGRQWPQWQEGSEFGAKREASEAARSR